MKHMNACVKKGVLRKSSLFHIIGTLTACLALSIQFSSAQEPAKVHNQGPVVLLDMAHHNAWNDATLKSFLEDKGFQVQQLDKPFSRGVFIGVDIVVIAGALSAQNAVPNNRTQEEFDRAWRLPTISAFADHEIKLITEWVRAGGALLLVADHMPLAGAISDLAKAFDIEVSNGFAVDDSALTDLTERSVAEAGSVIFRRSDGTLSKHLVTDGRNQGEHVETVATFVGAAFRLPQNGESLLNLGPNFVSLLPEIAWRFSENTAREPIGNWSQGGLLQFGRGRLGIFGELGILATPEAIAKDPDLDNPQKENPQLLLNLFYWLSGLIE